jgi:hypothetical protein
MSGRDTKAVGALAAIADAATWVGPDVAALDEAYAAVAELMRAVASYQGECESPCPCHVMKQQHRREMFVALARLQGGAS